MSCTGTLNCDCGCCAGTSVQTPQPENNVAGLSAISYRVATWATFKESMLARLSSSDYPALSSLTNPPFSGLMTRSDDDFTIALIDAAAVMLDVLTFYQERLANESYLRTATQPRSLTELSRLIGYVPAPGVSAQTYLAFTLKTAPGQSPDPSTPAITIPAGSQVQSVPGQGQTPQTFETSADISAKPDWNALAVQSDQQWVPQAGDTGVYLQGTSTQLQPGDLILIVGDERINDKTSNLWDLRVLAKVEADTTNGVTYMEWTEPLGGDGVGPAQMHPKFYALRQRASLFGYNAINPFMLAPTTFANISGAIQAATIYAAGTGYQAWTEVTPTGVQGNNGLLEVTSVNGGAVQTLSIVNAGIGYETKSQIATSGGTGTGLTVNITANMLLNSNYTDWNFAEPAKGVIDLDAIYSKVVPGGWIALVEQDEDFSRSPAGFISLYGVNSVTSIARSAYSISAKISRVAVDTDNRLSEYYATTRQTSALAQSDELAVAPQPLTYPLYGTVLDLETLRPDLVGVQAVAVSGCRQKIAVSDTAPGLSFAPLDTSMQPVNLNPGDILTIISPPAPNPDGSVPDWSSSTPGMLNVQDASGRPGTVNAPLSAFTLVPSASTDPEVQEFALVSTVNFSDTDFEASPRTQSFPQTQLQLQSNLLNCYDRTVTTVNANVGLATHGQSVSEIMGSGSASTPNQSFTLKQTPLTYVQAVTPTGSQSTLQVQVNQVQWTEVPTLYEQGPSQPVFATLNQSDGTTDLLFGDGIEGSTLPTGQNNLQANYRVGSGAVGNVAAGAITTLMDRPIGVSGVTNPQAATGGQDPQSIDDIRANAPQTVLTLGRAVSITDYQNFATTFAGVEKAYAVWIPSGSIRGVFLTVAGVGGASLQGSSTVTNLAAALRQYGNPLIPVTVKSYVETLFSFSATVKYDPSYDQPTVQAAVLAALDDAFGFDARSFGQSVGVDQVAAAMQGVPGVVAVNVSGLTREVSSTAGDWNRLAIHTSLAGQNEWTSGIITFDRPFPDTANLLYAYVPIGGANLQPAEILVLDTTQVTLGVMS
jgi:hypothetical protein